MATNSGNPLSIGEDLFVECEIGLDDEINSYILESHSLQIRIGAEPFYLWSRVDQGVLITKSITSFITTAPQYSAYVWQPSDGKGNHPNARIQENKFSVFNDGSPLTRVIDPGAIATDTEYALWIDPGTSLSTVGSVRIYFNSGLVPGNIAFTYRNICSCVDISTGYPNRECPLCRGTSYPAAFEQYTVASTKYSPINTILVRVPLAAETLTPEQIGRVKRRDLRHWMQNDPIVNNFDIIMGTTGRNAGILFEIVSKSDSRWRGLLTHQTFNTIRIEETDIRYQLAPLSVAQTVNEAVAITIDAEVV